MKTVPVSLEKEMGFFERKREELLKHHEGKFVLIIGEDLLGAFDTGAEAYRAGIEARGNVPMLIKRVAREETTDTIPVVTLGLVNARL